VLERLDIDQEDIDEVAEKAKKGLGMLGRLARKGLERGAELASQGIEVAKDTIEERRASSEAQPAPAYTPVPAPAGGNKFCPNCGQSVSGPGKFCNHCGQKLE
jgi:membrane protease subunit (stomatin/prohibitin family)